MSQTQTQIMPANERVAIELGDDGVAQVRLIRADKMNALDPEMFARIIEAGELLNAAKGLLSCFRARALRSAQGSTHRASAVRRTPRGLR